MAINAFPGDNNIRANQSLIDAFISGLRSDELSIKLLQRNFQNVTEALNEAKEYLSARDTRKYLNRNSARCEILVNRAALQDSPSIASSPQSSASTANTFPSLDQQLLTENQRLLTENQKLLIENRQLSQFNYATTNLRHRTTSFLRNWNLENVTTLRIHLRTASNLLLNNLDKEVDSGTRHR